MAHMKIGEVARQSGVGIETIRYYERERLLAVPQRTASGYRLYDASVVTRLEFIRRTKGLGFTLPEIRELLGFWFNAGAVCEHVRQRAELKVADIEERIRALQKMKRSLNKIIRECQARGSLDDCPLLEGLDGAGRSGKATGR